MPRPVNRSGLKLSKLARHIIVPPTAHTTDWPLIQARCTEFGITFDKWQTGIGEIALARNKQGQYAAGAGGVWLSIPRQTGKTYLLTWLVFAAATLNPDTLIIWTAHHNRTSTETFNGMKSLALNHPGVKPYIHHVRSSNGEQEIHFNNHSRILFGSRAHGFGRGFAKVDIFVFDECQILSDAALADMTPAANAAPNGLILCAGTPPRPKDPGEAFSNLRHNAIAGDETEAAYIEFSADESAGLEEPKQILKANPSYPYRTTLTAIKRMRKMLGEDSFRREALGIWDKTFKGQQVFKPETWEACTGTPPETGTDSYAVRFTPDGAAWALAAARRPTVSGDPIFIEAIRQQPVAHGFDWLIEFITARKRKAAQIVIDGKAGTDYLIEALRDAGIRNKKLVITPNTSQAIAAYAMFMHAVTGQEITHSAQPELTEQAQTAVIRKIGSNGGHGFQPPPTGDTVALLEAAALAYWAAKTTTRTPGRKQSITT